VQRQIRIEVGLLSGQCRNAGVRIGREYCSVAKNAPDLSEERFAFRIDEEVAPGTASEGVGGARKRMKAAKSSISLSTASGSAGSGGLVPSLGVLATELGHASSLSVWNNSLEMPISML
jgi:hypothetical protein